MLAKQHIFRPISGHKAKFSSQTLLRLWSIKVPNFENEVRMVRANYIPFTCVYILVQRQPSFLFFHKEKFNLSVLPTRNVCREFGKWPPRSWYKVPSLECLLCLSQKWSPERVVWERGLVKAWPHWNRVRVQDSFCISQKGSHSRLRWRTLGVVTPVGMCWCDTVLDANRGRERARCGQGLRLPTSTTVSWCKNVPEDRVTETPWVVFDWVCEYSIFGPPRWIRQTRNSHYPLLWCLCEK